MHPAPSLVASTTLTGMGFGLMAWLGMLQTGHPGWVAAVFAALAYALAGGGLLAARRPAARHRSLAAFAERQTAWHARETWLAVATLATFALYVAAWLVLDARTAALGWLVAALAVATVASTGMIYASQPAAPRWNTPLTPALFVAAALAGGALLAGSTLAAIWSLAALALLQTAYWLATGREGAGTGRRPGHGHVLALLGLTCAALLPLALLVALPFKHGLAALIVALHLSGMVALRWLFFADAGHAVGLPPEKG